MSRRFDGFTAGAMADAGAQLPPGEQEGEDLGSVVTGQTVQLAGDGEDKVEIVDWQNALKATLDPGGQLLDTIAEAGGGDDWVS